MRKTPICMSALALVSALSACSSDEAAENNIVAEDLNVMTNLEEQPPAEPMVNAVVETPAAEEKAPAAKPAPEKPAPAKPKPAEPKAAEPKAPDPTCLPEHRAAGHC